MDGEESDDELREFRRCC